MTADTSWPAGDPNEAAIREEMARDAEMVPCAASISRGYLERLDNIVAFFDAIADFTYPGLYDDAWNLRNHLVPFVEGDAHFDSEAEE